MFFTIATCLVFLGFIFGLTIYRKSKTKKLKFLLSFFILTSFAATIVISTIALASIEVNIQNFKIAYLLGTVLCLGTSFLSQRNFKKNLVGSIYFMRRSKKKKILGFFFVLLIITIQSLLRQFALSGWSEGIPAGLGFGYFVFSLFALGYVYKLEKKLGTSIVIQEE